MQHIIWKIREEADKVIRGESQNKNEKKHVMHPHVYDLTEKKAIYWSNVEDQ